jgi:hypothetical protein
MRTLRRPTRSLALALPGALLLALAPHAPNEPAEPGFVHHPTERYDTRAIEGFTVHVSPDALSDPESLDPALRTLQRQLQRAIAQTPTHTHDTLRAVEIWIERNNPDTPGACYHPSAEWLRDNRYNTDKARAIEIGNTTNFVAWVNADQPSMILHELAHAYHHTTLGYDDERITRAYERAKSSTDYESVAHVSGDTRPHYALTNDREYFAELTESYFGYNDFFPFTRDQLRAFDPIGYAMIRETWGITDHQWRDHDPEPTITP